MVIVNCLVYLAVIGFASFLLGRFIPKTAFNVDRFPFKSFPFEKGGKIYDKIKIKAWQGKVIDMSRIFKGVMPAKSMIATDADSLKIMIHETCVAELVHALLVFAAIPCLFIWKGAGGIIVLVVYGLGNIPFLIIQRYNRPRLINVYKKTVDRQKNEISEIREQNEGKEI